MIKIKIANIKTGTIFYKTFNTEFERDKFIRKLRYSTKLLVVK